MCLQPHSTQASTRCPVSHPRTAFWASAISTHGGGQLHRQHTADATIKYCCLESLSASHLRGYPALPGPPAAGQTGKRTCGLPAQGLHTPQSLPAGSCHRRPAASLLPSSPCCAHVPGSGPLTLLTPVGNQMSCQHRECASCSLIQIQGCNMHVHRLYLCIVSFLCRYSRPLSTSHAMVAIASSSMPSGNLQFADCTSQRKDGLFIASLGMVAHVAHSHIIQSHLTVLPVCWQGCPLQ